MSRKQPSKEELRSSLLAPHFSGQLASLEASDPISKTPMVVDVRDIEAYEHNPRTVPNRKYEAIVASLRSVGLERPLAITIRTGTARKYTLYFGNNTVLRALHELCDESPELRERFSRTDAHFYPWVSEFRVLMNHLKENEDRDDLIFIDRARAIRRVQNDLEQEMGSLTQRAFVAELARREGYVLNQSRLAYINYAVDVLESVIPNALRAGLGRASIEHVKRLHEVAKKVWAHHLPNEACDPTFLQLVARQDHVEGIDIERLRADVETEIADRCSVSRGTITLEFEAVFRGGTPRALPPKPPTSVGHAAPPDCTTDLAEPAPTMTQSSQPNDNADRQRSSSHVASSAKTQALTSKVESVASLRTRLWKHATLLAGRNYLEDLIERTPAQGCGYLLTDVPDPALEAAVDEHEYTKICALWWDLVACSEMTVAPVSCFSSTLPGDSVLREALEAQDIEKILDAVVTSDPGRRGEELLARLDDEEWGWHAELLVTYRRLRYLVGERHALLWTAHE